MQHDIDIIKERVHTVLPDVKIEQLQVSHPGADDDGVWFFSRAGTKLRMQLESSTYDLPFIIESDFTTTASTARSVDEAVEAVQKFFSQP